MIDNTLDPADENPYAAPQAELTAIVATSAAGSGPCLQTSFLRNAVNNTFYIYLALLAMLIVLGTIVGCLAREWQATLQAIWAGGCIITVICWPVGIVIGCLGMVWDYLLQLFGFRRYSAQTMMISSDPDSATSADWGNILDGK